MFIKIFTYLILGGLLFGQQNEKYVAKIGKTKISESEFKERFDFSVHPNLKEKERQKAKHEFLEELIAEKLLSLEAHQKGLDTLSLFKNIITPLENMFVRDALYSMEIKSKAGYSDDEISECISRNKELLKVNFIYSKDPEELRDIYSRLKAGASFDSLVSLRKEAKDQVEPRQVTFGTMEKNIEDELYSLKIGEFTKPLNSKDGLYILKLSAIENNVTGKDPQDILEDIKRIAERRKEHEQYLNYYHEFFSKYQISADKQIFEKLIAIFVPEFKEKYLTGRSSEAAGKMYLIGPEITSALSMLKAELKNKTFIKLPGKTIRADYFLNQLSHEGFYIQDKTELSIRQSLSAYIRKFIEDELLTINGSKKGLGNSPEVKKYINMWKDSYLSKILMMNILDSIKVSDQEAYDIFKKSSGKPIPIEKVKIAEVFTDSLQVVELVLKELSEGKNIHELAGKYTKRDSLKNKGGEFEYFPVTKNGELGRIASKMNIGQVYGPIKLDNGYSVFQLLGRIEDKATGPQDFSDVKDQIILKVTMSRFENHINEYIAALAQKYGVEIDENFLSEIKNVFLNLMVVRYMGFGGEIYAVPFTEQFTGWYKLWQKKNNVNL